MYKNNIRRTGCAPIEYKQYADSLIDLEGTYRADTAEATWSRLQPLLKKAGITRVADVTGLDTVGTPTYMVVRPLSRSLSVSQGKGISPILAKISGVMESMEAFHSENFVPVPVTLTLDESEAETGLMQITDLPLRPELNVDSINRIHWVAGETLSGDKKYVPRELIDLDFTLDNPWRQNIFAPSSNGLAAGNTENEALVHALCELCERDQMAFALVKKEFELEEASTRLKLNSIDDELIAELLINCKEAGLELAIWDCRSEINIPCFICSIYDEQGSSFYQSRASGSGCHPDKRVALLRAITEAFQSRLTSISGSRDDKFWKHYYEDLNLSHEMSQSWIKSIKQEAEKLDWQDINNPMDSAEIKNMADVVKHIIVSLNKAGIEEIVKINLQNDRFNIPVVKVIAAKMEQNIKTPSYTPGPRMQAMINPYLN